MAAREALSEGDPRVARLQSLLAALRRGLHVPDLVRVRAVVGEPSEHQVSSFVAHIFEERRALSLAGVPRGTPQPST